MTLAILLFAATGAGETLVLKERAGVESRHVRLLDLLEPDRLTGAARVLLAGVYLGRAPEDGKTRTITAEEIRRELEVRGIDPAAFTLVGERVDVAAGAEDTPAGGAARRAIAFEIRRIALERFSDVRPQDLVVRVAGLRPAALPEGAELLQLAPIERITLGDVPFRALFSGKIEVSGTARILRAREAAFAARDILPGKVLDRADLEHKWVETAGDERYVSELALLAGATAVARVRRGSPVLSTDVRLKPVVRRGDVVRAVSPSFEVDARALQDGAPGDEIALEFVATKKRLRGRVADGARVEVGEVAR